MKIQDLNARLLSYRMSRYAMFVALADQMVEISIYRRLAGTLFDAITVAVGLLVRQSS